MLSWFNQAHLSPKDPPDMIWCHYCYLIFIKGTQHTWYHSDRSRSQPLLFPSLPQKKFDTVGLNLLRDSVLAYFLNLGALSPAGVQGLSGWYRLLTLTIMIMDMTSSTYLLPPQISLNRHQPAGPVGMSPTLDFFPCFCSWHLQSELRSPASCYLWEVIHPVSASVSSCLHALSFF